MGGNDKPAILPAAEIEAARDLLASCKDRVVTPGSLRALERALAALLAHIDALTAGDVDKDALGRLTRRARHDAQGIGDAAERAMPWATMADEDRSTYSFIGSALYTIGRAAGRSEREAERASLLQQHRVDRDLLSGAEWERDEARAESARLRSLLGEWELAADLATPNDHRPEALSRRLATLVEQAGRETTYIGEVARLTADLKRCAEEHERVCRLVRTTEQARDEAEELAEDRARQIARLTAALADAEQFAGAAIDNCAADRARALAAEATVERLTAELAAAKGNMR